MLTAVAVFLLVLLTLLAIPVSLAFEVSRKQTFKGEITLRWLFGLVRVRTPLFQPNKPARPDKPRPEDVSPTTSARPSNNTTSNFTTLVRQKALRRRIARFVSDFWYAVQKRDLRLWLRIGLGDPADTGQLWAVAGPVAGMLANVRDATISLEPDFLDTTFELEGSGNIRFIPLQIISLVLALLLSPPLWQALRRIRKAG